MCSSGAGLLGDLDALPPDVLDYTLKFLAPPTLCTVRLVSHGFCAVASPHLLRIAIPQGGCKPGMPPLRTTFLASVQAGELDDTGPSFHAHWSFFQNIWPYVTALTVTMPWVTGQSNSRLPLFSLPRSGLYEPFAPPCMAILPSSPFRCLYH